MPPLRNRSIGTKVTDEEYEQLESRAEAQGLTLGEWAREVLLGQLEAGPDGKELILAEVVALRSILLNTLYRISRGDKITGDEMQAQIERADQERFRRAAERQAEAAKHKRIQREKPGGNGSRTGGPRFPLFLFPTTNAGCPTLGPKRAFGFSASEQGWDLDALILTSRGLKSLAGRKRVR